MGINTIQKFIFIISDVPDARLTSTDVPNSHHVFVHPGCISQQNGAEQQQYKSERPWHQVRIHQKYSPGQE